MKALRPDEDRLSPAPPVYVDRGTRACHGRWRAPIFHPKSYCAEAIWAGIKATKRGSAEQQFARRRSCQSKFSLFAAAELLSRYPESDAKGANARSRQRTWRRFSGGDRAVNPSDGHRHDVRAPDYDDWSSASELGYAGLNGDIPGVEPGAGRCV